VISGTGCYSTINEFIQRVPRVSNSKAIILEDTFKDQDYDQEVDYIQEEIIEFVLTNECKSPMYIFEENNNSQDNVLQSRVQENKPKIKENLEKGKEKENVDKEREKLRPSGIETNKQQLVVNQSKNPPKMK
jgi:hypothetical protein